MSTYGPDSTVQDGEYHILLPIKSYYVLSRASDIYLWPKHPSTANNSQLLTYGGDYFIVKRTISWLSNG